MRWGGQEVRHPGRKTPQEVKTPWQTTACSSTVGKLLPQADALNREGAPAYALEPKHPLAQYAATGCLNSTFYAGAGEQLETVLALCAETDRAIHRQDAVYCRRRGFMKDLPALLCAVLSKRAPVPGAGLRSRDRRRPDAAQLRADHALRRGRPQVLGTLPKRLVQQWLDASEQRFFEASVGNDPSLADIVKMVHPKPADAAREALYGYFVGRAYRSERCRPRWPSSSATSATGASACRTCRSRCSRRWSCKPKTGRRSRAPPLAYDAHEPEHVRAAWRVRVTGMAEVIADRLRNRA